MGDTAKDTRQRIVAFTETRDLVVKERVLRMLLFGSKETRTRAKAERLFGQGIEATRRVSEALCMRFNPQSRRRVRNNDCCVPEEA